MARTITEIKQIILDAKAADSNLAGLTSTSATALFKLIAYVVASCIWTLEKLFDAFNAEIDTKINTLIPGTIRWYHQQAFNFQYGDSLSWLNNKFVYAVPDVTKQIIKRVAIQEAAGILRIKVCKETGGVPVALTTPELDAFSAYMESIKFAGTNLSVVSYAACLTKFTLNITYDPLVLTDTGTTIIGGTEVVKNAVSDYLKNIVYGGVINRTKLIDAVQLVPGVVDVYIEDFEKKEQGASTFTVITTQNFGAVSGYYTLDTLTLNTTANV